MLRKFPGDKIKSEARSVRKGLIYGPKVPQNDPNIGTIENIQVFFTLFGCSLFNF